MINKNLGIKEEKSRQKDKRDIEDIRATEYKRAEIFKTIPGREHEHFQGFPNSPLDLDYDDLFTWIYDKHEDFSKIYGDINL